MGPSINTNTWWKRKQFSDGVGDWLLKKIVDGKLSTTPGARTSVKEN